MLYRISDASFTSKDGEGNDITTDGGLYVDVPEGTSVNDGHNLGAVVFQTNPAQDESAASATQDAPPSDNPPAQ